MAARVYDPDQARGAARSRTESSATDLSSMVAIRPAATTATVPGFAGPGTNLAGLFNLTGVTNRTPDETELWDTWIVGAPVAGSGVDTVLTVAEVKDLNHDGIYNDAPDVVTDANGDGRVDYRDLRALGVASNIVRVPFHISAEGRASCVRVCAS